MERGYDVWTETVHTLAAQKPHKKQEEDDAALVNQHWLFSIG